MLIRSQSGALDSAVGTSPYVDSIAVEIARQDGLLLAIVELHLIGHHRV